jgi:outer membrane biosynthesis protein TonB
MLVRVLQFLLGAALAGGGGYLAWTHRADASNLFPPGAAGLPLLLLAGTFGVTSGIVFLVSSVHPRSNQKRALAARASREEAELGEADAYYSQRARVADRDWRSGDITPLAPPARPPEPPQTVAPKPEVPAAEPPAKPAAEPVARSEPAANGASAPPPSPFPAQVTLAPLPRAAEPPPVSASQSPKQTATPAPATDDPHAAIRTAICDGKLDEADRMLTAARDTATGMDLALLTALAADHAAVSGRQSHAKWLWRLALKRFGEQGALNSDAAKAVAENLRQAG